MHAFDVDVSVAVKIGARVADKTWQSLKKDGRAVAKRREFYLSISVKNALLLKSQVTEHCVECVVGGKLEK